MKKIKWTANQKKTAKGLLYAIMLQIKKSRPHAKKIDSNIIHFIAYRIIKKFNLDLPTGWYINGPYVLIIDDLLIELKLMKPEQHQFYGDELRCKTKTKKSVKLKD